MLGPLRMQSFEGFERAIQRESEFGAEEVQSVVANAIGYEAEI